MKYERGFKTYVTLALRDLISSFAFRNKQALQACRSMHYCHMDICKNMIECSYSWGFSKKQQRFCIFRLFTLTGRTNHQADDW